MLHEIRFNEDKMEGVIGARDSSSDMACALKEKVMDHGFGKGAIPGESGKAVKYLRLNK